MAIAPVEVAFSSSSSATSPAWVALPGASAWTTNRGRDKELSKTEAGTGGVTLTDTTGTLDPTSLISPHVGQIAPLKQIRMRMRNPVTGATTTQMQGLIEDWTFSIDKSERIVTVTINCVDGFESLAAAEVPVGANGSITYLPATVQDRIKAAAEHANWPAAKTNIFSGNVYVQATSYEAGHDLLSVMRDGADAEFPGVANLFMSKSGLLTFHGRYARFQPANYAAHGIHTWNAGDRIAAAGHAGWARISDADWAVEKTDIINACLATPEGIALTAVDAQLVTDAASIDEYGVRSMKLEGLITAGGITNGNDAKAETKLFATYYVTNFAQPQDRVSKLVFSSSDPDDPDNHATWALMCGVEIGDLIIVTTHAPGSSGFVQQGFFVERIQNDVGLGNERFPQWTQTLEVSPQQWYRAAPQNDTVGPTSEHTNLAFISPGLGFTR